MGFLTTDELLDFEQKDMIHEVLDRLYPDESGRQYRYVDRDKQVNNDLGLFYREAQVHAYTAGASLLRDNPKLEGKAFERQLIARIKEMKRFTEEAEKALALSGRKKTILGQGYSGYALEFVRKFFTLLTQYGTPYPEQVKSFRLTKKFLPAWLKRKPIKMGKLSLHHELGFFIHPEMPLALVVRTGKGTHLATLGGYLALEKKKPAIVVTNIQGTAVVAAKFAHLVDQEKSEAKRPSHERRFKYLNAIVQKMGWGQNWRLGLLNQLTSFARERGLAVVGQMPWRFPDLELYAHKKMSRQYRQTYKKSGLTEQADKTWRLEAGKRRRR